MRHLSCTIMRRVSGLFLVWALIISCPAEVLSCHIEYSDWLIDVFEKQGVSLNKRVGNFSSYSECEAAIRKAVEDSGDPNLASNMSCVGCNEPYDAPGSQTVSPPSPMSNQSTGTVYQSGPGPEALERERREAFERDKQDLLARLGKKGRNSSGLKLKTSTGSGSGLALKTGTSSTLHLKPSSAPDDTALKVREAQQKIIKLKKEVAGIQTLLRQCTKSLTNNSSEFNKWGNMVDKAYNSVLDNSREYLTGLFLKYCILKRYREVQKDTFGKLDKYINSPDSKIQAWLRKELGGRRIDADKLEQLVELGQAEGDFAALLQSEDKIRQNLDAIILVNDLLDIVDKGIPGGEAFQHARMIGETYADLTSICYGWFSINRLEQDRAKLVREVESLSMRMRKAIKEIECLEPCTEHYADRCMERCTGVTRLHSPPPLPR